MFRAIAMIVLVLSCALAHASDAASLSVGDSQVRIGVPDGYVRASESAPTIFSSSAAALPPSIRLVEALVGAEDLKRMLVGEQGAQPYLQVQVIRDVESLEFSAKDWESLRPVLAKQMGAVDLDAATQAMQSGMGKRMGEAAGTSVEVEFGEIGKPTVYSQEGGVVRYSIRLPVNAAVNGTQVQVVLNCAGAALVLNGKLLMLNAYLREDLKARSAVQVREFLANVIQEAQALNAETGLEASAAKSS